MVQLKLLGAEAVRLILVPVPLQIDNALGVSTVGVGFTVTVIEYELPAHKPVVLVGVTTYDTVPAVALLGFVNIWLIVGPEPAPAPVIPPVTGPIDQVKLLGAEAVRLIFGLVPLQITAVLAVVTTGVGLTVTVILYVGPVQVPVEETGVTIYTTEPAVALPGLVSTWLMVEPVPATAPVTPPVMVPIVHVKLLGAEAVREILGLVPLHITAVAAVVTTGVGCTVTVMVNGGPTHEPVTEVGVTTYATDPAEVLPGFVSIWLMVGPEPALAPVILPVIVPTVQAKVLGTEAVRPIFDPVPLQMAAVPGLVTIGVG
jgi:hypothetical protein